MRGPRRRFRIRNVRTCPSAPGGDAACLPACLPARVARGAGHRSRPPLPRRRRRRRSDTARLSPPEVLGPRRRSCVWSGSAVGPAHPRQQRRLWSRNLAASCLRPPACGGGACSAQGAGPRPRNLAPAETPSRRLPARGGACQLELAEGGRRKVVSLRQGRPRGARRGAEVGFPFGCSGCPPSKFVIPPLPPSPPATAGGRLTPRRAAPCQRLASAGGCAWGVMMMECLGIPSWDGGDVNFDRLSQAPDTLPTNVRRPLASPGERSVE